MRLTGKQLRHLRALGHHLDPVVQLGKHGITDAVVAATNEAITVHELVKVKRSADCPTSKQDMAAELARALDAEVVQILGHTALLYRRHPDKPVIELPR
ncbi:MAG: ribosome assembly RNA-binding protein YhbY [Myxococcales bacterium]|nr:ribosome assembly RNA-binding protein YhbY [Myxococcales bacterium]